MAVGSVVVLVSITVLAAAALVVGMLIKDAREAAVNAVRLQVVTDALVAVHEIDVLASATEAAIRGTKRISAARRTHHVEKALS